MKETSKPSRPRLLVAVAMLAAMMLACAAGSPTPAARLTSAVPTPPRGSPTPRAIPTLVPTYTRLPSLTPTSTPTNTRTRTPTATRTVTRTPTATRTPLPTAAPGATGSAGGTGPTSAARPALPVCPQPQTRTDLRGKIIFKTDRENASDSSYVADIYMIYVMEADGSNQTRLSDYPECGETTYEYFQRRLSQSNDGLWRLLVERSGSGTSIFLRGSSGQLVRRVTTLDGTNYDPAWAPDQARLAFVSQVDMNDEIYTVAIDGTKTRRLTFNTWEWDKHPSWSVDGQNIVFWSNRETARKQIWIMRDDGQGQRNLSNNSFSDWDPIWVNP